MLIRHIRGRCGKKRKKERNLTLFTLYTEFTLSNWLCLLCLDNHVQSETALCSIAEHNTSSPSLSPPCPFTFRWSECSRLVVCRWGQDAGSDYFSGCFIAWSRRLKLKSLAELVEEESSLMGTQRFCYHFNHWNGVSHVEVSQHWLIYPLKWIPLKSEDLFSGIDSSFGIDEQICVLPSD